MEHLWSPWRNAYISKGPENPSEIFSIIAQSSDDEKHFVLTRGKSCFSLLNTYPYNAGHLMIVPYRKVAQLDDLTEEEWLEMFQMLKKLQGALMAALHPHGFNVGLNLGAAAGAGIAQHLHLHLVPRWENDSNFMTTIAETRVHPNDLPTVYRQLKEKLTATT